MPEIFWGVGEWDKNISEKEEKIQVGDLVRMGELFIS